MDNFNNDFYNKPAQDMEKVTDGYNAPPRYNPTFNDFEQPKAPKKKEKRPVTTKTLAISMCACILLSGVAGFGGGYLANKKQSSSGGNGNAVLYQSVSHNGNGSAGDSAMNISDVVANTANSVVEITTESVTMSTFMRQYVSEGAGSGVIISTDGYIVTNHHVIENATKITVRTKDGTSYDAKLIGSDERTDLAVIKIEAKDLKAAVFGDSDKLVVGETAVAMGNPLGELGGTVTSGIISALDREIEMDNTTMTLLQFDAAINPGNSGGGLFNAAGELVGIVNAKSSGAGIEGLGFAIPGNSAKEISSQLIKYGYVKGRVDIGFTAIDLTNMQNAVKYRISETGIYVKSVTDKSNGLQSGDKIVKINDTEINTATDFSNAVKNLKVGETVNITVKRNNRETAVKYVLAEETPSDNTLNSLNY